MIGFFIAMLSGVCMSVQGVFNTQVTKASSVWTANTFVQGSAFLLCLLICLPGYHLLLQEDNCLL